MSTLKQHRCIGCILAGGLVALMFCGAVRLSRAQEASTNAPAKDSTATQEGKGASGSQQTGQGKGSGGQVVATTNRPPIKEVSGAELYSMHCARCHPERYPNERTSAQWKTIAMHMRVRANLPAEHFRKVLKYLQDNSGY
jgi:hypothetical protein